MEEYTHHSKSPHRLQPVLKNAPSLPGESITILSSLLQHIIRVYGDIKIHPTYNGKEAMSLFITLPHNTPK
jgi:hypothetical protein